MKINKNNKKVIKLLERGSSHILYQNKILAEEYDLFSYKKNPIDPKIIQKEIREYNLADYIVVPSEFAKRSFIDHGINKNKILKIPYGVNLKQFNRSFLKNKEFTIICVGTVSLRKGSYYLMKAFKELNLTNSKLIFVGTIDPEIQQIIKPFVNDSNINFIGHVSQNRLKEFYSTSHISVICSIEEGMAMVQAQAMASGVPLICTTNSGGEDIVDENVNGFICPIRDVEYLKEKISFFYNNRNILKLFSDNAYNKAQNFLSWDNYGKRVSEEYKKLATKHL
jgi:glycosyltransferase involved in cell wall biosynthesis